MTKINLKYFYCDHCGSHNWKKFHVYERISNLEIIFECDHCGGLTIRPPGSKSILMENENKNEVNRIMDNSKINFYGSLKMNVYDVPCKKCEILQKKFSLDFFCDDRDCIPAGKIAWFKYEAFLDLCSFYFYTPFKDWEVKNI